MSSIKELLGQNKFIRVDAEGEHEEILSEFAQKSSLEILDALNRNTDKLVALYEKTQNKKFLNDIALSVVFKQVYSNFNNALNELDKNRETIINDTATLKEQIENIASLENENDTLKQDIENYKNTIKRLEESYNKTKEDNAAFNEQIKDITTLKSENDTLKQDIEKNKNTIKALEESYGRTIDENKKIKSDLQELSNKNKELEQLYNDIKRKWQDLYDVQDNQKLMTEDATKRAESLENDLKVLKSNYVELENKYNSLEKTSGKSNEMINEITKIFEKYGVSSSKNTTQPSQNSQTRIGDNLVSNVNNIGV